MRKYKVKKAAQGLQDVAVPEQGSASDILSSTTSMAGAGLQFGPWGALAGGVLGFGAGLLGKSEQDAANKRALTRNKFLASNRAVSGVDASIDQRGQYKKGTKMIEIEGKETPEIHTDKNFNVKNLGTTPHSKGGDKVMASEGDIVFNTQNSFTKYNKIASAIKSGDRTTLQKEKNKLPEDTNSKAQDGKKSVKSQRKYHLNSYGDKVYDEEQIGYSKKPVIPRTLGKTIKDIFTPRPYTTTDFDGKPVVVNESKVEVDKPFVKNNINKSQSNSFNIANPLSVPGIPNPKTGIPAKSVSKIKPKSAVGKQGKKVSSSTVPVSLIKLPKLVTDFGKADTGDGSDLRENKGNIAFPASVADVLSPKKGQNTPANTAPETAVISGASSPSTLNNVMQMAGVANNLFQGIKSEKPIPQTYFNPELNKYEDRSQSLRNQSTAAAAVQGSNARNVSGGSASNLRANQQQAALSNLGRQNSIDEQEMSRRDAIEAQNTGLKNQAAQYNLQRKDQYESQYKADRLRKQEYIDTAASDIGQLGMARQEEAYLRSRDDKAEAAQEAGYKSINGRYQHKSTRDGDTYFEPDADSGVTRYGLPKLASTFGTAKKKRVGYAKGTKAVKTSKYKMK